MFGLSVSAVRQKQKRLACRIDGQGLWLVSYVSVVLVERIIFKFTSLRSARADKLTEPGQQTSNAPLGALVPPTFSAPNPTSDSSRAFFKFLLSRTSHLRRPSRELQRSARRLRCRRRVPSLPNAPYCTPSAPFQIGTRIEGT